MQESIQPPKEGDGALRCQPIEAPDMIGIVYNPMTNKGASVERMKKIREMLDSKGIQYEYRESTYAGESIELANELSEFCDTIVSAGGDGTFYECLNGSIGKDVTYYILPMGSGNDTSITLDIRERTDEEHIDRMVNGEVRLVDCSRYNDDMISMQFAAFGIVPEVLANFLRKKKSRGINYVLSLLGALIHHRPRDYRVIADGEEINTHCDMVAIMNIKTAGGGLKVCPEASIQDRKLDLVIVERKSFLRYWCNVVALARGKLLKQKNVIHKRIDCAEVFCPSAENCVMDGEMLTFEKLKMEIYPKQIKMRV